MVFKVRRIIKEERSLEQLQLELEELDFEYCLPKYFYLDREWLVYTFKRLKLISSINKLTEC